MGWRDAPIIQPAGTSGRVAPWANDVITQKALDNHEAAGGTVGTDRNQDREAGVGLPQPTPGMFDSMAPEDAQALYDAYSKHPNTQKDWMGNVTYNGVPVEAPKNQFIQNTARAVGNAVNPIGSLVGAGIEAATGYHTDAFNPAGALAGGMANAPKNNVVTGLATQEQFNEQTPKAMDTLVDPNSFLGKNVDTLRRVASPGGFLGSFLPEGSAAAVDKAVPEYQSEGGYYNDLMKTGGEVAPLGFKVGAAEKLTKELPRFFKWATNTVLSAGSAATSIDKNGTALSNDLAATIWHGVALDPNGKFSSNLLKQRMQIFMEAAALAKPTEMGIKGVIGAVRFANDVIVKPSGEFLSNNKAFQAFVREMSNTLQTYKGGMTNDEQYRFRMKLADDIEHNANIVTQGLADVTKSSGENAGMHDVSINRDTMTSYARSLDPNEPGYNAQKAKVQGMINSQKGRGSPFLEEATGQASRTLDNVNTQTETAFGGPTTTDNSRQAIQQSGHQEVQPFNDMVAGGKQRVNDAESQAKSLVQNDPTFGPIASKDTRVQLNVQKETNQAGRDIVQNSNRGIDSLTTQKNDLYKKIPDDVPINKAAFETDYKAAEQYMSEDLKAKFKAAGVNFQKLHEVAGFELMPEIREARGNSQFKKADALSKVYKNIHEDQIDYLITHGDTDVADAARAAKQFYMQKFAPFANDGITGDMKTAARDMLPNQPGNYDQRTLKALDSGLSDPFNEMNVDNLAKHLATEEGGQSQGKLADYAIGKAAQRAQELINVKGKLDPEDILTLTKDLQKYGPTLDAAGGNQGARIEEFLTKLRDKTKDVKTLQEELKVFSDDANKQADDVYGRKLKEFFSKNTFGQVHEQTNTQEIFDSIFNGPDSEARVADLTQRVNASNDSVAKDGLKAWYGKWVKSRLQESSPDPSGAPLINKKNFKDEAQTKPGQPSKIVRVGEMIFGKDHPVVIATDVLANEAGNLSMSQTQRAFSVHDTHGFAKQIREATGGLISFMFGALNKTATRIRATSGRAIARADRSGIATMLLDKAYADPEAFAKTLREVAALDLHKMSKETESALLGIATRAGWLGDRQGLVSKAGQAFGMPPKDDSRSRKILNQSRERDLQRTN